MLHMEFVSFPNYPDGQFSSVDVEIVLITTVAGNLGSRRITGQRPCEQLPRKATNI